MSRTIFLIICLAFAVLLFGCAKSETNSNSTNAAKPASGGSSTTTTTTETAASSGDKIGIPECDEYIAKYESCTGKVPEAGRAAYKSGLDQTRASWKKLADNPQTRSSLAAACKQAAETQAAAWKMYGCN